MPSFVDVMNLKLNELKYQNEVRRGERTSQPRYQVHVPYRDEVHGWNSITGGYSDHCAKAWCRIQTRGGSLAISQFMRFFSRFGRQFKLETYGYHLHFCSCERCFWIWPFDLEEPFWGGLFMARLHIVLIFLSLACSS